MSQSTTPTFDRIKAKALIDALDTSAAAVARAMGLERQTVGHWLRGRGEPDMKQIHAMAKELGIHWLELVNEDALVVNEPAEIQRVNQLREASPELRNMIDALLAASAKKAP